MRTAMQAGGKPRAPAALKARSTKDERRAAVAASRPVPPPPPGLGEWEVEAWRRLKAILDPLRVYTPADEIAFRQLLVTNLAMILEAEAAVREHGLTVEGPQGVKARPEIQVIHGAEKILLLGLARFGLTPSDRSRVAEGAQGETEFERARRRKMEQFGG